MSVDERNKRIILADPTDTYAQLAALGSEGDTYVVKKFGDPNWWARVGVGRLADSSIFVTGAGFTGSTVFDAYQINFEGDFVKLQNILSTNAELANKLRELERKIGTHTVQIQAIFKAIQQLMVQPEKPRKRIGFR